MVNKLFEADEDLRVLSDAQAKTIIGLNKTINELRNEVESLKISQGALKQSPEAKLIKSSEDEETIARTQLNLLKNVSLSRELTYEETKKVDIYAKLLLALMNKNKNKSATNDEIPTDELLKLVE